MRHAHDFAVIPGRSTPLWLDWLRAADAAREANSRQQHDARMARLAALADIIEEKSCA